MKSTSALALWLGTVTITILAGCGGPAPRPLAGDAFLDRRRVHADGRVQPVDNSGPLIYDQRVDLNAKREADAADAAQPVPGAVQQAVKPVGGNELPPETPLVSSGANPGANTTKPATQAVAGGGQGQFQLVGAVLADVNGTPIFADKVLKVLSNALETEARKRDPKAFKVVATDLINRQVIEFVNAELEYAMAKSKLEPQFDARARGYATQWRIQQIAENNGSEELARRKWAADGYEFDERVQEQYRTELRRLYYTQKEAPKIQVRQRDIREYYEANKGKEFTTEESYTINLIKFAVDASKGAFGKDAAVNAANDALARIKKEEAFAKLANQGDNPFKSTLRPFAPGGFAIEPVEQAVQKLSPGQVTGVIEAKDKKGQTEAYYIAQLVQKTQGRVVPFEEAQDGIKKKLQAQQFTALRQHVQQQLRKDSIINVNPRMQEITIDMAMQRYPQWAAVK